MALNGAVIPQLQPKSTESNNNQNRTNAFESKFWVLKDTIQQGSTAAYEVRKKRYLQIICLVRASERAQWVKVFAT